MCDERLGIDIGGVDPNKYQFPGVMCDEYF